ncbi:MAG: hypothetical protein GY820_38990 [Gammaproteobacteria bacterium]|nr:hypothetical protein [Gammaproteobacteria bacterium]
MNRREVLKGLFSVAVVAAVPVAKYVDVLHVTDIKTPIYWVSDAVFEKYKERLRDEQRFVSREVCPVENLYFRGAVVAKESQKEYINTAAWDSKAKKAFARFLRG